MKLIFKYCVLLFVFGYGAFAAFDVNAQSWNVVGSSMGWKVGNTQMAIDGSGTPYIVYQYGSYTSGPAAVLKYYGGNWVTVGSNGFPSTTAFFPSIAINGSGTPYVAYIDSNDRVTVMKYSDSSWEIVGSPEFAAPPAYGFNWIAMDGSGTPYVVCTNNASDTAKVAVMKYDGTNWVTVGNPGFSTGVAEYMSIAISSDGTPYVVYSDLINGNKATVMKYNGSNWAAAGSVGFSTEAILNCISLAIDGGGTPYVVYAGQSGGITTMKYNSSNWVVVGDTDFAAGQYPSIAIDGSGVPYVFFEDGNVGFKATVMKYNDSNWAIVGNAGFSNPAGWIGYPSIAIDGGGTPYVIYDNITMDDNGDLYDSAMVMKYGFPTAIQNVTTTLSALTIFPNPTTGLFTLHISSQQKETATITITNILGEKVNEFTIATNMDSEVQISAPPGVYFVTAVTSEGKQSTKVVVE